MNKREYKIVCEMVQDHYEDDGSNGKWMDHMLLLKRIGDKQFKGKSIPDEVGSIRESIKPANVSEYFNAESSEFEIKKKRKED